jgi:hypothetical protein
MSALPQEKVPSFHSIGGMVGPRASLDTVERRKVLTLSGHELQPLSHPVHSQSLYQLHYPHLLGKDRKLGGEKSGTGIERQRNETEVLGNFSCLYITLKEETVFPLNSGKV